VYINKKTRILIVTYVDDFLVLAKNGPELKKLSYELSTNFLIQEMGDAEYFLGVCIVRDRQQKKIYLC
jgi:Reverse transcriptase (RNA-dependent DNA polymerase)